MIKERVIDKKRSIGLASKEIAVESHVLRFWEKEFPFLKPIIGKGSRRYYFDNDIGNFLKIKYFLYEAGYTIKGLQTLLENNKNLLRNDLETIQKMTKIITNDNVNSAKITESLNNLIITQGKIVELMNKMNKYSL